MKRRQQQGIPRTKKLRMRGFRVKTTVLLAALMFTVSGCWEGERKNKEQRVIDVDEKVITLKLPQHEIEQIKRNLLDNGMWMCKDEVDRELDKLSPQQLVLIFRQSKDEIVWRRILEKLKGNF